MFISALAFALQSCGIKYLYVHMEITPFEVVYWRSVLMVIFQYLFIKGLKVDHMDIPTELKSTVLLRSIAGFIGLAGLYTAFKLTSLSKASVIWSTNPIFTAIYARVFLKENLSYYDWFSILACFFGIILLQNPFGSHDSVSTNDIDPTLDVLG